MVGDGVNADPLSTSRGQGRAWPIVGGITLLLSLSFFVPWQPYVITTAGIDDSWMLALNALFAHHPRFGHDLVFTYGPWGFLHTRAYYPQTYPLMLAGWAFFAVAFWRGCWAIGRRRVANPAVMLVWMLPALGIAALDVFHQSATPLCLIGLLLVHYFDAEGERFSVTALLLVSATALASLTKFSYFVAAAMVIGPITLDQLRKRRVPSIALSFVACFVLLDLAAGQRLADLPAYLRLSMQGTSGYTDAMSFDTAGAAVETGFRPPLDLLCFLAAAGLLVVAFGRSEWRRSGRSAVLAIAALGGVLFTTFKWGFVRHDAMHTPLAGFVLLFLALLCAASHWTAARGRRERWALAAVVAAAAAVSWDSVRAATGIGLPQYCLISLTGEVGPNLRAAARLVRPGDAGLSSRHRDAMAAIRKDWNVPTLQGSVDVYPWSCAVALAGDLQYQPRPVFQSYGAYTPDLAALNVAHIRGPHAPDHLLLHITDGGFPLDRFPTADDAASWPEWLTRYDVERTQGEFLMLRRAESPRHWEMLPVGGATARLNAPVSVPATGADPIWATIQVEPTPAGRLLSALYKNPEFFVSVRTRDGRDHAYRLCTGTATAGFLLSPLINSNEAYVRIAAGQMIPDDEVSEIRFFERGWLGRGWSHRPDVSVRFFRLSFSRR